MQKSVDSKNRGYSPHSTEGSAVKKAWEMYPKLTETVRVAHRAYGMEMSGHSFDHALYVGQVGVLIAEDEDTARLAGVAGLCHNADRMLQKHLGIGKKSVPEKDVVVLIRGWLEESGELALEDQGQVIAAVLKHSGPNLSDGDRVLEALQDADRVCCSRAETVMGTAQSWSELPAIDSRWLDADPSAHPYKDPRSVLNNLTCRYDWVDPTSPFCVRLPRAKALMERRVAFLRAYVDEIKTQRAEIGLWPYPVQLVGEERK